MFTKKNIAALGVAAVMGVSQTFAAITLSDIFTSTTLIPDPDTSTGGLDIGTFADAQIGDMVVISMGTNRPDSYDLQASLAGTSTGTVGTWTAIGGPSNSADNVRLFYSAVETAGSLTLNIENLTLDVGGTSNATAAYLLRPGSGESISFAGYDANYVPAADSIQDGGTSLWQETINLSVSISGLSYTDAFGVVSVGADRNEGSNLDNRNSILVPTDYTQDSINGVTRVTFHSLSIAGLEDVTVQSAPSDLANDMTAGLGVFVAVPEPATFALLAGLGALGFLFIRRRRK